MVTAPFKVCSCCSTVIPDLAAWNRLRWVGEQVDEVAALELRDCKCGSTIAVVVEQFGEEAA